VLTIKISLPKRDLGKIRSGVKVGSVFKSKKEKAKEWRKRKYKNEMIIWGTYVPHI